MKKIAVIIIAVVCFSCGDRYMMYTMSVDNQTSDTIIIVFIEKSPYAMINPDSLFFPPMQKKMLFVSEGRVMKNGCDYTGIKENEVIIYSTAGRELRKEIWIVSNWKCSGSKGKNWDLTFVVTEDDLE